MKRVVSSLSFVLFAAATALRAQNPMTAEVTAVYKGVSANILKAAEKMPEADYAFKPAPEIPNFWSTDCACRRRADGDVWHDERVK